MKNVHASKIQKGVGFVEVLIAAVVIAVGLMAVASLQGKLMLSSGQTKTRSEAQVLAERKIEELKNVVSVSDYNAIASDSDTVTGTNAAYSRGWTITGGDAPARKTISVKVSWDSNGDGAITTADDKVNVTSEMAWVDPAKSAFYAGQGSAGTGAAPSPRQNASEDVASENVLGGEALTASSGTAGTSTTLTVSMPADAMGQYSCGENATLRQVAPGSVFYTASHSESICIDPGVIAVFKCAGTGTVTCTHIQNHFGGVALRIAGTVYSTSGNGLSHINVAWTSSEVHACYIGPITTGTSNGNSHDQMPYECVLAGNCNATADGVNNCYPDSAVSDSDINSRNVGPGGEYGDVGLLGVIDQTGHGDVREQICFLEDTTNPPTSPLLNTSGNEVLNENYLYSVTKRLYVTRKIHRNGSSNEQKSEGINRSYTNHNFLIIARGTGTDAKAECNKIAGTTADGHSISLAPRQIIRTLNEATPNAVMPETAYAGSPGTALYLIGNVVDQRTDLALFVQEIGNCYLNNNIVGGYATGYVCTVPYGTTTTDIIGGSNEYPSYSPAVFSLCAKASSDATDPSVCQWTAGFSSTLPGTRSCLTPWGESVAHGASVTANTVAYVPTGDTCPADVTRTCNDGTLSAPTDAIYSSCNVLEAGQCLAPWGAAINNGASVQAYSTDSVAYGETCPAPEARTCTNGSLSGTATYESCTVQAGASCTLPWGIDLPDGQTVQAYSVAHVAYGSTCPTPVERACTNGSLSGSGDYQSCTVDAPCTVPTLTGRTTVNAGAIADVDSAITAAGFIVGSKTDTGAGDKVVQSQTPAAGSLQQCNTSISYTYN